MRMLLSLNLVKRQIEKYSFHHGKILDCCGEWLRVTPVIEIKIKKN